MSTIEKPAVSEENTDAIEAMARQARIDSLVLPSGFLRTVLPQLPESRAHEVYERMVEAERRLTSNDGSLAGYTDGSAKEPDEMLLLTGSKPVILSAEHATAQLRDGGYKEPDTGTAALVQIMHQDKGTHGAVMLGKQTSDANYAPNHPFRDALIDGVRSHDVEAFASLHGVTGGKFYVDGQLNASRPYDLLIGVGNDPSEETLELARNVRELMQDMGFNAGINQPFIVTGLESFRPKPVEQEGGTIQYRYNNLRAATPNTTRATLEADARGRGAKLAALQLEFSDNLRIRDNDREMRLIDGKPDTERIIYGVYAGYLAVGRIVDASLALSKNG